MAVSDVVILPAARQVTFAVSVRSALKPAFKLALALAYKLVRSPMLSKLKAGAVGSFGVPR
jgi:hypothetical protein